jgi:putative ABC transport system permease protein
MRTPLLALAGARLQAALPKLHPALAALVLALATLVGVSSMIDSFRGSVIDWLDITLSAPVYISDDGAPLPADLEDALRRAPGVSATGWLHALPGELGEAPVNLVLLALPPAGHASHRMLSGASLWPPGGSATEDGEIAVMAGETLARRQGLAVGDRVQLRVGGRERALRVVGVYQDYRAGAGSLIARRDDWPDAPTAPTSLAVYLPADALEPLRGWFDERVAPGSTIEFISAVRAKRETMRIFDRTFLLTRALRWILALVGAVGVCGALLALQVERRAELRLLHRLGLQAGEQRRLLLFEALLLAAMASLLALPLGWLLGWLLTEIINLRAFGWHIDLVVTPAHGALMLAVGLAAGLAAAGLAMLANARALRRPGTNAALELAT